MLFGEIIRVFISKLEIRLQVFHLVALSDGPIYYRYIRFLFYQISDDQNNKISCYYSTTQKEHGYTFMTWVGTITFPNSP